ncbi:MAG: biotin/lipoyl-binding protein [Muribaculaceae bacterium]|jgi:biotin carboxyl carrier protein|nr:biotin/lipoyl-binding protein [Muribaculaceae bacterium]MBQ1798471.1 biotin/lipoyl-binding protein [Muribaculaceae bacterium]MBQ2483706.1 biotin/lipoyl-binding protein [Muribaculaceae bacterium]MBQ4005568.1 biotin/lipoyl-binding protein [Muribaculaceae bacterium]
MKEYKYKINGNDYTVAIGDINDNVAQVEVNGVKYDVELPEQPKSAPVVKRVSVSETTAAPAAQPVKKAPAAAGGYVVASPLPGVIKDIFVKEGQAVKADDVVCILEAMKMGNEIHAGQDGVIKSIDVAKEDSVLEGTTIMVIG